MRNYVTRVVGVDERHGIEIAVNSDGEAFYVTPCCGASAKGCDGYTGCRACYVEVDPATGDLPPADWWAPHQRHRVQEFADFMHEVMMRSLGLWK
jgi:hypothetical protein